MKKLLFCMVMAACAAHAAKVSSVAVKLADGGEDTGDVLARCMVKAGDEYDPQQCARDVRTLRAANEFEDITVKAEQSADGVAVTYVVTRKKRFQGPLNVKGNDYWGVGKIISLSELRDGYAYGEAEIAAAAGRIRTAYQRKFFPDVRVTPRVEPVEGSPNAVTITMEIEEGPRVKIRDFTFDGIEGVEASELREAFQQYPWWNPLGWFVDTPATPQDFAEARDKVANYYRDLGYLDVSVSLPEAVPVEGSSNKVDRVFKVVEGTRYKVGKMSVTGVKQYPEDAVLGAVKNLHTGDMAGAKALADAAHDIEVFCGSGEKALADTHVTVRRIPTEEYGDTVDLVFAVEEGVPVVIRRVLVRGNDYTKDKVIRREIGLSPGDPMLANLAERSNHRLENLRYFQRVQHYLETVDGGESKDGKPEERDLVFEVEEQNTGGFMVGLGAGTESSVFGQVEIHENNFDLFNPWRFRGGGQKGRILVQAGPRIQTYEVSVTEPWLFDRHLEFTVTGYRRLRWFDDYDVIRSGIEASLSYPVQFWPGWKPFGRFGVSLAAEYVEMDDVEKDLLYEHPHDAEPRRLLREQEDKYGDSWEIPLIIFWRNDTRDEFLFPKKGYLFNIHGDIVGGDNEYWRTGFRYRHYWTAVKKWSHVLQWGLRAETVDAFNGDLPIYDKLFLGGSRSIRGVDFREIAPRVYSRENKRGHYVPWGGKTSWCATMEYSVPIVKMVRVAAFTDLGSVGEDEFDFDTDWFCWSVGLGLRLDLPQFPIRLDFATPIVDPDEDVDEKVFSFTIGYDF